MGGDILPPQTEAGGEGEYETKDDIGIHIPAGLKEKLAGLGCLACEAPKSPVPWAAPEITRHPSGLLGTDDDKGLYRSGRRLPL